MLVKLKKQPVVGLHDGSLEPPMPSAPCLGAGWVSAQHLGEQAEGAGNAESTHKEHHSNPYTRTHTW